MTLTPEPSAVPKPSADLSKPAPRTLHWIAIGAAILTIVTAVAALPWVRARTRTLSTQTLAVSVLLPEEVTIKGTPALSPDGGSIAFAAVDAQMVARIWLRSFDRLETRPLAGTEGADQPFWSPDSRSLGFFARGKLWTIDLKTASPPRALADAADPRGGTWGRENIIVFSPQPDRGLYRIAADGGPAMPLSTVDRQRHEVSHVWPRFLPDGRVILFMKQVANNTETPFSVTAIAIDGGGVKSIVDADSTGIYSNGRLLYYRDGKVLAQPFDTLELNLSGEPSVIAEGVWTDGPASAGLVGFDAAAGLFASRPALAGGALAANARPAVIHLLFNWNAK